MRLFFSVGEPSGDLHGANLIRALRATHPDWEFVGYGGPRMAEAGCQLHADLTQLAVMWIARVLVNLHKFVGLLWAADRVFRDERPDAVVLIDYPGFNWWIARRAKARGIPVFYYGAPQIWAWASHRIRKMQRYVDHVLCKLPFEERWFNERGCRATYVGHPYFDELRSRTLDEAFVGRIAQQPGPLVVLLPGSRTQEVEANAPALLRAAGKIAADGPEARFAIAVVVLERHIAIRQRVPRARFAVAAFNATQAAAVEQLAGRASLPVDVHVGRTPELISAAACCLACSGSVSLELLYHARPSVVLYQVGRVGYFIQSLFRRSRYITLVNLLSAERIDTARPAWIYDPRDPQDAHVLLPEYLTCTDKSDALAEHVVQWLRDPAARAERVARAAAA
ncbi:MAG TPA: lipid-A-disaccharide synthase [Lacipirellulaceae bacterium]|nr:lipid-A-disaccharide synthase [Lacipirellulaceae bacterium]